MSGLESKWIKIGVPAALLTAAGAILLSAKDDENKISEHFVDCDINPHGSVSFAVHPGEEGQANMGEAYKDKSGKLIWRSLIEVHYKPEMFILEAGGYSPPGSEQYYKDIPEGDSVHDPFIESTAHHGGYIDAAVVGFDADNPLAATNAVTFTYHCGAPPPEPLEPPVPPPIVGEPTNEPRL